MKTYGRVNIYRSTSTLVEMSGRIQAPAPFAAEESPIWPLDRILNGPQNLDEENEMRIFLTTLGVSRQSNPLPAAVLTVLSGLRP
jgi:hypothetical protein